MSFAEYFSDGRQHHTPAAVDATGRVINAGYDTSEGVQKVAMMVWNSSLLAWQRGTSSGGGGGGFATGDITKRIDKRSATEMYVGSAPVGTVETSTGWGIQKITFDSNGNAISVMYVVGIWQDRYSLTYA